MSEIELAHVGKRYGAVTVLNDISLQMGDGEFVVLVGPSGCGKSTLLRMIAGLEDITSGQITIGGKVVNNMPAKERDIAMVFQSYALYPQMKVADNMSFSLRLAGTPKAEIKRRVGEAADILGLEDLLDRLPRELSGGQRQRVAMGRAIVRNPRAFLFDEPLSNLDAKLRVKMRGEIKRLHQRLGKTMIYVTHDQTEAMTMADKIVVLSGGRIEQAGAPLELYNNPANLFVASFIGSPEMNLFDARYQGGTDVQVKGGQTLPLGATLDIPAGTEIVYGVRPQHITLGEVGVPSRVLVVEPTGDAQEVLARIGEEDISVVVRDHAPLRPDDTIHLVIDPAKLFVFDKATGLRLR
ncbi:MAG: sn-glycerol-3-phosphate ABC transporter ATP-binding protein UgpC [Alphaproteobacteria bacterium]|nr:sn-glycerol-3-phosphate ABC transporter ATP-binding protein UgpC [Alphaproteobacteria bacterium]MBU1562421.1 sn-glycerol-3-phosphate ABC transporter ATP-binding protein UgpC [Alphaproteobacteria bacterium]MBU2304114.1 sn-glycerol-3-phosphate ABC transporter ATP-binding protein UgpC [Alphaproteobacteria bacterium]